MNRQGIERQVRRTIIDVLELDMQPEDIDGSDLIHELQLNSIDAVSIFVFLENTFQIDVTNENLSVDLLSTLDGIVDFIADCQKRTQKGENS